MKPPYKKVKDLDLYSSVFPILVLSFISGLSPCKIIGKPGSQELQVSNLGIANTLAQLFTFIGCFIKVFIEGESMVSFFFDSEISKFGDNFQLILGSATMCSMFMCSLLNRRHVANGFCIINKIDLELIKIGMSMQAIYRKTRKVCMALISILSGLYIAYMACSTIFLNKYGIFPHITVWWAFLVPNLMISIVILQFLSSLFVITERMKCLNKLLKELMDYNNLPMFGSMLNTNKLYTVSVNGAITLSERNRKSHVVLDTISKIYDAICDSADVVNSCYAVQMLSICSVSFLLIVFNIYYTLLAINNPVQDPWKYFGILMFFACQTFMYFFQVISIVNICTLLYDEADRADVLVMKLLNEITNKDMKIRLSQISMQISHRKPIFTAWGLFVLNRALIHSITGAASTYLIILFQFSVPVKCIIPTNSTDT